MAGSSLDSKTLRYRDGFEPVDAAMFRLEAGLMTFALLAMSVTYFLKIVYEAVIAERNFVDAFLIKWIHGVETQPATELIETVHGLYSPVLVGTVLLITGVGAARAIEVQLAREKMGAGENVEIPRWTAKTIGVSAAIIAGFIALAAVVVNVHSGILCGVTYGVALLSFGVRAKRRGELTLFAISWGLLSLPVAVLITRIPGQYAWVNDLSKILIMYVGFIGASMASRDRKHIVLNFGRRLWPAAQKRPIELLSLLIWLLFDVLLLVLALHLFELQASAGSTLSILQIPEYHIILPVVLSFALMSVRVAADFLRVARGTESYLVGPDGGEVAPDPVGDELVEAA